MLLRNIDQWNEIDCICSMDSVTRIIIEVVMCKYYCFLSLLHIFRSVFRSGISPAKMEVHLKP